MISLIKDGLISSAAMLWEMFWPLTFGFAISAIVMVFVPRARMAELLGGRGPATVARATFFGAISSSCSYAAAAMARTLFSKGASFVAAVVFMLASTNLVIELSAALWTMLGWQFVVAEIVGGLLMISLVALIMSFLAPAARAPEALTKQRIFSPRTLEGWREVAASFRSEVRMLWKDIALGLILSGAAMTFIPETFWRALFLEGGFWARVENAFVGPWVAVFSFVCSVGNIPLAHVLYARGISFAGALSFIYADLIIVPLLLIYRKHYGTRLALWMFVSFYFSMALSGLLTEWLFARIGWIPPRPSLSSMAMNAFDKGYTFWLNLISVVILVVLWRLAKRSSSSSCCH